LLLRAASCRSCRAYGARSRTLLIAASASPSVAYVSGEDARPSHRSTPLRARPLRRISSATTTAPTYSTPGRSSGRAPGAASARRSSRGSRAAGVRSIAWAKGRLIARDLNAKTVTAVRNAVESLPDRELALVRGHHLEGKSLKEIAGSIGMPYPTAKRLLRAA